MLLASIQATDGRFSTIICVDRAYRYIVPVSCTLIVFATIRIGHRRTSGLPKMAKLSPPLNSFMDDFVREVPWAEYTSEKLTS